MHATFMLPPITAEPCRRWSNVPSRAPPDWEKPDEDRQDAFIVNGQDGRVSVEPRTSLADCLGHELKFTGTHVGCEHGVCGACTVLVDGKAMRSA